MKRFLPVGIAAVVIGASVVFGMFREYENPDPNHTHADFAVWVNGQQLDFTADEFMSGVYVEGEGEVRDADPMRKYLHLHDGVGHVIHRHKPGLTLQDFLQSVGVTIRETIDERICVQFPQLEEETCEEDWKYFSHYTNDPEQGFASSLKDDYVFNDGDKILITNGSETTSEDIDAIHQQWLKLTDDSCKYSKTCPWRGAPPAENCIADPTIPCVVPE